MIQEAIVLAGGLGTRLRAAVPDLPKCMARVAGRPFVDHVIQYYKKQGISRFIFSLGYLHDIIEAHLLTVLDKEELEFVIEDEPLGTGGAIRKAAGAAISGTVLVLNGDTLFKISLPQLSQHHQKHQADCSLCLKPMTAFDRYGVVELGPDTRISNFQEKKYYDKGLINGGVYALQVKSLLHESLPEKFSFEKDYLEQFYRKRKMTGLIQNGYFIDIGIPEDFNRAQTELAHHE